jgi:hypothetical protein
LGFFLWAGSDLRAFGFEGLVGFFLFFGLFLFNFLAKCLLLYTFGVLKGVSMYKTILPRYSLALLSKSRDLQNTLNSALSIYTTLSTKGTFSKRLK